MVSLVALLKSRFVNWLFPKAWPRICFIPVDIFKLVILLLSNANLPIIVTLFGIVKLVISLSLNEELNIVVKFFALLKSTLVIPFPWKAIL